MPPTTTQHDTTDGPLWLTPAELAERQKVPERTLAQWRYVGRGPRYAHFGKHVRYHRDDVAEWEASQRIAMKAS